MRSGRVFSLCLVSFLVGGVLGGIVGALGGGVTGGFVGVASGACTAAKVALDQGLINEEQANQVIGTTADSFLAQGKLDRRVTEAMKGGVQGCLQQSNQGQ